ncbi:DUF2087 domain-containing protein [Dermabacteraceae bacterium P13101]
MNVNPFSELRLLLNVLCAPRLRAALVAVLQGGSTESTPVRQLSFVDSEGGLDTEALLTLRAALNDALGPESVFERGRLELPVSAEARLPLSERACREAFARNGWDSCTEPQLNAALGMLVDDVALARRDCVDTGLLERDTQGARYRLARPSE